MEQTEVNYEGFGFGEEKMRKVQGNSQGAARDYNL
jgi:hypothetical protein